VPDTLSRLTSSNSSTLSDNYLELDALYGYVSQGLASNDELYIYTATLIEINNDFRLRII